MMKPAKAVCIYSRGSPQVPHYVTPWPAPRESMLTVWKRRNAASVGL